VGIWPSVIYNIDLSANSYSMAAYVWFLWKGDLDPTKTVEFDNNVDSANFSKVPNYPQPITLPDGRHYQCLRVEGKFFQAYNLQRFPLEDHTLNLIVDENTYSRKTIVYKFDSHDSGVDAAVNIPGWRIKEWIGTDETEHYPTNFGDPTFGSKSSDYAMIRFQVIVTRPVNYFIFKMMLPLMIILLANWTALFLHPKETQTRIGLSGTALLTTVFLQQGYSSNLPVTYLVLMDKIYVVAFILIVASLIQEVIQSLIAKRVGAEAAARALWIDTTSVIVQITIFAVSVAVFIVKTR